MTIDETTDDPIASTAGIGRPDDGAGGAVLAGFLLTALPNWTRTPPLSGAGLVLLALAWLAARAMALTSTAWPEAVFATIDLAFLSALVLYAAAVLARTGTWRNFVVLAAIRGDEELQGLMDSAVTASVGGASCVGPNTIRPDELVRRADRALYHTKQRGRDGLTIAGMPAAAA